MGGEMGDFGSHGRGGVVSATCYVPATWESIPPAPSGNISHRLTSEEALMGRITSTMASSLEEIARVLGREMVERYNYLMTQTRAGTLSADEQRECNSFSAELRVYDMCCITQRARPALS
jgi:hypothetical protein